MKNFQEESSVWSQNFNPRNVAEAEIERNPTKIEASDSPKDSQHQDLAVLMVNSRDRVGRPNIQYHKAVPTTRRPKMILRPNLPIIFNAYFVNVTI